MLNQTHDFPSQQLRAIVTSDAPSADAQHDGRFVTLQKLQAMSFFLTELKVLDTKLNGGPVRDDLDDTGLGMIFTGEIFFQLTLRSPGGVLIGYTGSLNAGDMTGLNHMQTSGKEITWTTDEYSEHIFLLGGTLMDQAGKPLDVSSPEIQEELGIMVVNMLDWDAICTMLAPLKTSEYLQSLYKQDVLPDNADATPPTAEPANA